MKLMGLIACMVILILFSAIPCSADAPLPGENRSAGQDDSVKPSPDGGSGDRGEEAREQSEGDSPDDGTYEADEDATPRIADPLYPWNKAMYHVNDRFYFWFLKPVAQGYSAVVPEDIRLSVSNFFDNAAFPVRFVSNLLQFRVKDAGNELVRFLYNSTAGVCGLVDAAKTDLGFKQQDEDLGQTFGRYGIGHGFYLVWPFLGPSSLRDTAGRIGDRFFNPIHYVDPTAASVGITVYDKVNDTSFRIGDYEDLKKSAVDPYISIRDAYVQYRKKKVED